MIRRITARLPSAPSLLLGPGDDAAVIAALDGRVVVSTDLMVEGRHFRREWSTAYDVGRKAAAASLADVVAMGARPSAIVVGFATPGDLPLEWVDGLADGLRDECALAGAAVAGGDIVAGDTVMLAVTALGDLEGRQPVTRAGAQPGDWVVLAGSPGRAAAGLALLEAGRSEDPLAAAHRRPDPPYSTALALAAEHRATAMIDLSDGLLADLTHLAASSRVRIDLITSRLPIADDLARAAEQLGVDPVDWALTGGDDHCFAATVPDGGAGNLPRIGRVAALEPGEQPGVVVTDRPRPVISGHEHFRG